jgi:hypothetical protein
MVEKISFNFTLQNEKEKEAYLNRWGGIDGGWDEGRTSVAYVRSDEGILSSEHGGWVGFLKTPAIISDDEWAQMKVNQIPERLINQGWI